MEEMKKKLMPVRGYEKKLMPYGGNEKKNLFWVLMEEMKKKIDDR